MNSNNSTFTVNMVTNVTEEKTPVYYSTIVQIDPSLNWTLFNIFLSQMEHNPNATPIVSLFPFIQKQNFLKQNPAQNFLEYNGFKPQIEDTNMKALEFSLTKSTSSSDISSQNVKKFFDAKAGPDVRFSDVFKSIDNCTEKCCKLNAREQLKLRKVRSIASNFY